MNSVAFPPANARHKTVPQQHVGAEATQAAPHADDATLPGRAAIKSDRSFALVTLSTAAAIALAFAIGRSGWFTPGDNAGYYIGLVGGVMMLLLLLYPLRKYVSAFRTLGKIKHWFAVHMVLGIAGPILVLAHSTFHMRSTNAAVAQVCMLVVAGSGIVGRFLYTKVHRGLYGEKINLQELQARTTWEAAQIRSQLHLSPAIATWLEEFQAFALAQASTLGKDGLRLLGLGVRRYRVERACVRELRAALQKTRQTRGWDRAKYQRRLRAATSLVRAHLGAAQRVAQFGVYDRLLRLWHVAHVPLVYLLAISAIAHVVAVHMY